MQHTPDRQTPQVPSTEIQKELEQMRRIIRLFKRALYGVAAIAGVAAIGLAVFFSYRHFAAHSSSDPVPLAIRRNVNFTVYYPDPAKLPAGYTLDQKSFSGSNVVVVYYVRYSGNQKLVFSVQEKPSATAIKTFYSNRLPLHNDVATGVGTAAIGAIGSQTIVSLPTNGNAWILMSGPSKTNQAKLQQILQAMQK